MKVLRKFPTTLNTIILATSMLTVLCFFCFSISSNITAVDLLFGENYNALQQAFITNGTNAVFNGALVFVMYFVFFVAMLDIILNVVMFIPSIQRSAFMAILYKTFLIFYGVILMIFALFGIAYLAVYIMQNSVNINSLPSVAIFACFLTLIPFLQSIFKTTAFHKYKRP